MGVAETRGKWDPAGIEVAHLATYDPDIIQDQLARHVSPRVAVDIVTHETGGRTYLVVTIREFEDSPLVCKKEGGVPGQKPHVVAGAVYVRPPLDGH